MDLRFALVRPGHFRMAIVDSQIRRAVRGRMGLIGQGIGPFGVAQPSL